MTDMKKALEKPEIALFGPNPGNHNRFPSLDSSVEENPRSVGEDRYIRIFFVVVFVHLFIFSFNRFNG